MQAETENHHAQDKAQGKAYRGPLRSPAILTIIAICTGIEVLLIAADHGLIGSPLWRSLADQNGAFWPGLLHNWRPNYAAQPWLMFITYAFLHAGFSHLAGNMLTLVFLGEIVERRAGPGGFVMLYALSAIGGAAVFGLMTSSPQPMVGASGALFGLAGAWQYWEWSDRRRRGSSRWPVWRMVFVFALLNALLWVMMDGQLAWQTHLGGFVTGWTGAAALNAWGRRK